MRDRPKYLPGFSYDQSGGPKSITRQNFEMVYGRARKPPCPKCHRAANVTEEAQSYFCSSCNAYFIPDSGR